MVVVSLIPARANELLFNNIIISCNYAQCLKNVTESGQRSVLTTISLCLPCARRGIQLEAEKKRKIKYTYL